MKDYLKYEIANKRLPISITFCAKWVAYCQNMLYVYIFILSRRYILDVVPL